MHRFSTTSGKQLGYDVVNNRISLWSPEKENQADPIVCFEPLTTLDASRISLFTIEMTQQCNLRCSYCCYSGTYRDRRAHNQNEISYGTLQHAVDFITKHANTEIPEITVCFYGGEALLAKRKMEWMVAKLFDIFGDKVQFSLSTNGFALTESVIDWICSFAKFVVNVTVDGNKVMHDSFRKTLSGKGSYDTITRNLLLFKTKYPHEYEQRVRFLSTVYSYTDILKLAEVWDNEPVLEGHYPVHISHIIPDFDNPDRTYDTREIKDAFYRKAFQAYREGKRGILYDCFEKLIAMIAGRDYLLMPGSLKMHTCFQNLFSCFINADGDLYACEKFCGENKMGNVVDGVQPEKCYPLLYRFTDRKNRFCTTCWAKRFCRICMTSLNFRSDELPYLCQMERDTIDLALRYFCEFKDWERACQQTKE